MNDLTESQLRHIAHPAAKPAQAGKTRSPAQPQRFEAVIPCAESEEDEPAAPNVAGSNPPGGAKPGAAQHADGDAPVQPGSDVQQSHRDPVASQIFVAVVAARVEQLRLWLRYGSGSVRVVAGAVVDVMRVPAEGQVYRHHGAPVLLMCSDAQTTAQFAASLRYGCLEREGAFVLLRSVADGSGGNLQNEPQEVRNSGRRHIVPVIMIQACEPGVPQAGDILVDDVEERLQQGGAHAADNFASLRWLDDDEPGRLGGWGREELLPWACGQGMQGEVDAAGPSTSRWPFKEVQGPRLGRMKDTTTNAVIAQNEDTPDWQGTTQCDLAFRMQLVSISDSRCALCNIRRGNSQVVWLRPRTTT